MRVLLFSGHMVDLPDRKLPRFPASRVTAAGRAIHAELDKLGIAAGDRAVTSGASGGDLLFALDCLARGAGIEIYLPYPRDRFVQSSVLPGGARWLVMFDEVMAHPQTVLHVMSPADDDAEDGNAYARCNLAMLRRALNLARGPIDLVCLWDGSAGDGPGGTEHMVDAVRAHRGRVHWIDTRTLPDSAEARLPGQV
jgi:hypothetical protein